MRKKHFITSLILLFSLVLLSQNTLKTDSLLKIYNSTTADSNKVKALNGLFAEYRYTNDSLANLYVNKSIGFAANTNYIKGYALALYYKGVYQGEKANFDTSEIYISKANFQYKKINDLGGLAYCNMAFGFNEYDKANFSKALSFFLDAANFREKTNSLKDLPATYIWIGNVYNGGLMQPKNALVYFEKALAIQKELGDEVNMASTYNNIGNAYYYLKIYDLSLQNHLKSAAIKEKFGNKRALSTSYDNIGNIYTDQNNYALALQYYDKALAIRREFEDKKGITTSYLNIGNVYYRQKKYNLSIEFHTKALNEATLIGNKEVMAEAYSSLSVNFEATGHLDKAIRYLRQSESLKDSILNTTFTEQIADMQTKYDVDKKDLQLLANQKEIEKEKTKRNFFIATILFFVILFIIAIWAFNQKRKTSKLLQTKNGQLETANKEISHQGELLSEKQKEIVDSINYAKKIQNTLLASEDMLLENLISHFVLFKPKDIVSGDFTWATKINNVLYLACCDSTGHGVPGAFMSLLNIGFLNEAVKERNITKPGEVFNYVRNKLIETLGKDEQQDGFDGILLCIDMTTNIFTYSASNNSPIIIRNNEVIKLQCNKMPVGKGIKTESFETFTLDAHKNDHLYLLTDGYPDQFGGPKGKKFKYKNLEELLKVNSLLDLNIQKEKLNEHFELWKGNLEQVDDVCVIGIKI